MLDLLKSGLRYGPVYAVCQSSIESDRPLDPASTWAFWTKPRSKLIKLFVENYPPAPIVRRILDATPSERHRSDLDDYYKMPAEFFMLWLDRKYAFCSCAQFSDQATTLEDAQIRKAERILGMIDPRAGDRLLELGCGWGAMIGYIRDAFPGGVSTDAITNSPTQANFISRKYGVQVTVGDFIEHEYPPESYDRIYSMGAWEHVPPRDVAPLVRKLFGALKPGGRLVQQFNCAERQQTPGTVLLNQLFFTGLEFVSRDEQVTAAEAAGFVLLQERTNDYRPTWKAWYDRLAENSRAAIQLVGVREYNRALLLLVLAWKMIDEGFARNHQFCFEKPIDGRRGP